MEGYVIRGTDAASVAAAVEHGVESGALRPNETLPSVRTLARDLGLSPTTVAAAYRELQRRGVLVTHDRSRTVVAHRPPVASPLARDVPEGVTDLSDGCPDVALLPDLHAAAASADLSQRLYTDEVTWDALADLADRSFRGDGIDASHLAIVGGALDGIERVLQVHCAPGDAIVVEDPAYAASLDLVRSLGLRPVPVPVDDDGPDPEALDRALQQGAHTVLLVPRAQNPTGAAWGASRATALREVLGRHPEAVVVEDDHAGQVAGAPYRCVSSGRRRWAVVRSLSKSLGPDLRIAVLAGDEGTVARLRGRQRLGTGWVSRLLQSLAATVWSGALADGTVERAEVTYRQRRAALLEALGDAGVEAHGRSGFNVWIPVPEEVPVVQGLAARGWAVQAGEPYRLVTPPGIRVTVSQLSNEDADRFVGDLTDVLGRRLAGRRG